MNATAVSMRWLLLVTLLLLSVTGCAQNSPVFVPPVEPARIPALQTSDRVSATKRPSICLPDCLTGQRQLVRNMQTTLSDFTQQAYPANGSMTPSESGL